MILENQTSYRYDKCLQLISYQYLGMTKIAGALNMLPKIMLQQNISNPSAKEAMEIYRTDRNYPKFYRNFVGSSDNGLGCCLCHRYKFDGKVLVKS
jgi:hypothetical protein